MDLPENYGTEFGDPPASYREIMTAIVQQCPEVLDYERRDTMDRPDRTIEVRGTKFTITDEESEQDYLRLNVMSEDKSMSYGLISW